MVDQSPYGRVALVSGPESLLADRAVDAVIARARAEDGTADVDETEAGRLDAGRLAELTGGSLFASRRVAVLRDLAQLPSELFDQVVGLAAEPADDLALVLVHGGGTKGKGLLDRLRKPPAKAHVDVVECAAVKAWELPQFVTAEVRRARGSIDGEAAQFLVEAIGHDLRSLAAGVEQLLADGEERSIGVALVRRYFGGRSEVTSFAVADQALAGRAGPAMEQLRWALSTGVPPVLVTSALASGLRGLGKFVSAGGGLRDAELAAQVGVPPWKLKSIRAQARGWDQRGLAQAIRVVAAADADIKGAAEDPGFTLERAVLAVSGPGARSRCRPPSAARSAR